MAEIDRIDRAIREHVEAHKSRERAMFTVAGVSALLDELSRLRGREEEYRKALGKTLTWAEQRCPCRNEEPNPCPLCGASIENLEGCKSAENTLPRWLLEDLRRARALDPTRQKGEAG